MARHEADKRLDIAPSGFVRPTLADAANSISDIFLREDATAACVPHHLKVTTFVLANMTRRLKQRRSVSCTLNHCGQRHRAFRPDTDRPLGTIARHERRNETEME
ncbi:uncharacterized protein STEHIDRAFT_120812 [Stereum hirsutum FP-91666 SS1]|uniref:uncharacterized protein n=1 Tax=Stereum hirsutum (strain FP-91666) TaxID=721885 RepID=UPI000440E2B5|nr:uncharacterized protein STEHIDRAFT_120812 [Stereum hirsutum FP-91666 SS1]EIM87057.1 hypothetical protein STEHIDRAFT_120812 [Stereum hirsutum FP-91666 SS1]